MSGIPQVDKSHYQFGKYAFEGRFVSYYWQLKEVLTLNPSSVLEVGAGDRVFGSFIKNNTTVSYTSVDVAEDLHPDVIGSILKLPFADKSFDVVCAFEVLEHLPFEEFDCAVAELCRVARTHIVISIPHFGPMFSFSLKIPFLPHIRFALKIPFPKKHVFNGQHHWELGKHGYPTQRVRKVLQKRGDILCDFVPFGNAYHHFFVVKV
ncbi:MAG: class I SAM-dependent methyltransferase [Candidatus Kaiserbacteria bacterium]|nr:class I SAM-dependent methyltransferase [Candidatus Kaiserbacteria bacterium]